MEHINLVIGLIAILATITAIIWFRKRIGENDKRTEELVKLNADDLNELKTAKNILENPGIGAKISHFIGKPIETGLKKLPSEWNSKIGGITEKALSQAAKVAIFTMDDTPGVSSSNFSHKVAVMATGAGGGFFGLPGLALELPISTTIMLRSIADIARNQGESIASDDVKLECLSVFAMGGESKQDDGTESGYYAVRIALAKSLPDAVKHLATKGMTEKGAPVLVSFISKIAQKFSIQISQKAASQLIPAIGAASGAIINTMFLDHFQDMARGHFTVRRLERKYGQQVISNTYKQL
jgi:hypothetical protein